MIKHFCDKCGVEMELSKSYDLEISSNSFSLPERFKITLCEDCVILIKDVLKKDK
jgi:hypothetical protein